MDILEKNRIPLAFTPTPLVELKRLSKALGGVRIVMKRDDLTGLALGGNKTRKLEFLIGDALQKGCDTIITAGAAQSNHCRQTAAAAAYAGLYCYLVLGGSEPEQINGNVLLDKLFNAEIVWSAENRKGEQIPLLYDELCSRRLKPYIIPYGGSNAIGALGYVAACIEMMQQLKKLKTSVDAMVFASSSGGTHAGLLVGAASSHYTGRIIGIKIDKDESTSQSLDKSIVELAGQTAEDCGIKALFKEESIYLDASYCGAGYGIVGDAEREAIQLTARYEGILLDPVYTGRAMAGLIDMVRRKKFSNSDTILFWHTGGAPSLFSYSSELL